MQEPQEKRELPHNPPIIYPEETGPRHGTCHDSVPAGKNRIRYREIIRRLCKNTIDVNDDADVREY
jgi:hypothetical protein